MNIPIEEIIEKLPQSSRKLFMGAVGIAGVLSLPIPEAIEPNLVAQITIAQCVCVALIAIVCVICQLLLDKGGNVAITP